MVVIGTRLSEYNRFQEIVRQKILFQEIVCWKIFVQVNPFKHASFICNFCRNFSFHSDTKNNRKVMFVRMTSNNAHTLNYSFCPVRALSGLNIIKHLYAKHVETHSRTLPNSIRQILLSVRQRAIWVLCKR